MLSHIDSFDESMIDDILELSDEFTFAQFEEYCELIEFCDNENILNNEFIHIISELKSFDEVEEDETNDEFVDLTNLNFSETNSFFLFHDTE